MPKCVSMCLCVFVCACVCVCCVCVCLCYLSVCQSVASSCYVMKIPLLHLHGEVHNNLTRARSDAYKKLTKFVNTA